MIALATSAYAEGIASRTMIGTPKWCRLAQLVRERSLLTKGEFRLASGRSTDFFLDVKATMMHPEGAALVAELVLDVVATDNADYIGGLEMGAVPIVAAVTAISQVRQQPVQAFFIRKQAKVHGTRKLIEGLTNSESLKHSRVVVVDDVTTTGGSALKAALIVRAEGAEVVRVVTVIDREEGAVEAFAAARLPFTAILTRTHLQLPA